MSGKFHKNKKVKPKFLPWTPHLVPVLPMFLLPFTAKLLKGVVWIHCLRFRTPYSFLHILELGICTHYATEIALLAANNVRVAQSNSSFSFLVLPNRSAA